MSITTLTVVIGVLALLAVASAAAAANASKANFVMLVVREDCWDVFFKNFDLFNMDCLKASISKCLGYGIIAGACIVKVPQLSKILAVKSVAGISRESTYLEFVSNVLAAIWYVVQGMPFSSYGECVIVGIGSLAVVLLVWRFDWPGVVHVSVVGAASAVAAGLALQTPQDELWKLQYAIGAIFAASRLTQIVEIIRSTNVAALAGLTLFLNFAGTAARVFTSTQEVGDATQLNITIFNAALNGFLLLQWVWYGPLGHGIDSAASAAAAVTGRSKSVKAPGSASKKGKKAE